MNIENFDFNKSAFSPMDNYYWIERGVFGYLQDEQIFKIDELDRFNTRYKELFETYLPKVQHLIDNNLDKGNVYFVLIVVTVYEVLLEQGICKIEAVSLTDRCINRPIRAYVIDGTKKLFDSADDPFQTLVHESKQREKNYFGSSFEFERPLDNEYGYVLNIRKCLFHETLKVLNRNELQPILCRMDLGWINGINPQKHLMEFVRPVTFATGSICQMWFIRKEAEIIKD